MHFSAIDQTELANLKIIPVGKNASSTRILGQILLTAILIAI